MFNLYLVNPHGTSNLTAVVINYIIHFLPMRSCHLAASQPRQSKLQIRVLVILVELS